MQKCVCIYFGEERHMERDEKKVCLRERERQSCEKKHPLIHSITQFPWWLELYLTMWRTFSASTFAVSLLHLFQRSELKLWMVRTEEKGDKRTFPPVSGAWRKSRKDVQMSIDGLDCNGCEWLSKGLVGQSSSSVFSSRGVSSGLWET